MRRPYQPVPKEHYMEPDDFPSLSRTKFLKFLFNFNNGDKFRNLNEKEQLLLYKKWKIICSISETEQEISNYFEAFSDKSEETQEVRDKVFVKIKKTLSTDLKSR